VQAQILWINKIPILNVSRHEALDLIDDCVDRSGRCSVFFANAHCINVSARDPRYHRLLQRQDVLVFGDGVGIRLAGRLNRQRLRDNVNGTDLFPLLCARAVERNRSLFLLGAQPGVPDEVARRMTTVHPGLRVVGLQHGYFGAAETDRVIEAVSASGADLLLVALGVPRQELWIVTHRRRLKVPVAIGVGALFDFYSGRVARAPRVLRRMSLEWLWRLAMEPRRMWRRYLVGNVTFLGRVLWWTLRRRNEPDQPLL
jgi:N-acetylglucosaminyldiphosphoundecaprenol N-acetyl-beta-D-mannosaminyltransferase